MAKTKVSKKALNNVFFSDRNWTRKEYQKLTPAARELLIQNINNIFWLKNPERYNARLDPSKPEDKPYLDIWLTIRDNVIRETKGSQYWEKRSLEDRQLRDDLNRYSRKITQELDKLENSINQPNGTPIWRKEPEPVRGILREGYTGKQFVNYINTELNEPGVDKVVGAFNIVSRAQNGHLINASRDPDGLNGLFILYHLLVSDPDNGKNILQANRVLAAIGSLSEPDKGLLDKPYIFPAQFTLFNSSHITAHQTPEGNIWVKLTQHSTDGHPEGLSLGTEAFTRGIELKPHEWVRFKLYDEGGITVCRPALYLLQLSNKSTKETWSNIINIGSLALPGGPFFRVGGIVTKGGGRLISVLIKLEKAADIVANGLILGNIAVRENRGWIIKTFPEHGKEFIEYFDVAATIATFYGVGKAMTTPVMRKALEKTVAKWEEIKNVRLDSEDAAKLSEVEKFVNEFKAAVKEFGEIDDTVKAVQEGGERTGALDDVVESSAARRQIRDTGSVLEVPTTTQVNRVLRDLEIDPDLNVWRQNRRVSAEEFNSWVNNLPEESRAQFLERLTDSRALPKPDSIGSRRFVLRDAAHEIRINKDLKEMGIDQIHGDFSGKGSKLDAKIAEGLSKNAGPNDTIVKNAINSHNQGRVHHNPVTADDYLHQALDQYDAVKDPLRAERGFGYRRSPMTDSQVREIFITKVDDPLKKKAMEAVLDWKEKGIDPKAARRDYHTFYNRHVSRETPRLNDGGGGGAPANGLGYVDTQRAPPSGSTKPPIPYSQIEIKYLGEETTEKIAKMGVDEKGLEEYLWRLNWEASNGDLTQLYFGRVQEGVKKVVVDQVEKSLSLGDELARKLVGNGFDPSDISSAIDELAGKGNGIRQIRESLNNESKLMDYFKDQLCGGQIDDAKVRLIVAHGDTRAAIKQKLWENMVENWNKENPTLEPGGKKLQQFSEKAEQLSKKIEINLFGSSLTGSAVIYQGKEMTKNQENKLEEKRFQPQKKEMDLAEQIKKPTIRESNKKKIQKNIK